MIRPASRQHLHAGRPSGGQSADRLNLRRDTRRFLHPPRFVMQDREPSKSRRVRPTDKPGFSTWKKSARHNRRPSPVSYVSGFHRTPVAASCASCWICRPTPTYPASIGHCLTSSTESSSSESALLSGGLPRGLIVRGQFSLKPLEPQSHRLVHVV